MRGTRTGMAAIVMAAVLVLGACSTKDEVVSSGSSAPAESSSTTAADAATTTQVRQATAAQAEEMLLTLSDLPPGWSSGGLSDEEDSDGTGTFFCPAAEAKVPDSGGGEPPTAEFSQGTLGPFLAQIVAPGGADEYTDFVDALDSCIGDTWTTTDDDGTVTTWTMAELSAGKLGTASTAYRVSGVTEGGAITVDMVVGHTDKVVSAVLGLSITTILGSSNLDSASFATIVETASGKLS